MAVLVDGVIYTFGSSSGLHLHVEYSYQRSGSSMQYYFSVRLKVSDRSGNDNPYGYYNNDLRIGIKLDGIEHWGVNTGTATSAGWNRYYESGWCTVGNKTSGSTSFYITVNDTVNSGWCQYTSGTQYLTVSPYTLWNDINAWNPAQTSQNGLKFNLSTSDGSSWTDLTNEPTSFTKAYGTTATISNIRSNVTGAHYSGSNIGSGTADPISWTFNTADYVVNLYTAWDTYAVTYDANGGTTTPAAQTKTYGQGLTLANAITRNSDHYAGYSVVFNPNGGSGSTTTEFAGLTITYSFYKWLDDDDTEYDGGGTYTKNKATTMWAAWDRTYVRGSVTAPAAPSRADSTATRTVTFNANGGTCDTPSLNSTATVSYTGLGWYAVDGTSITRRVVNGGTYTPTKDEILYQQWSTTTGTFTSITLPTPTRSGYIFLGWNEDPTASSGITGSYTPASSVTLYALWELDRAQARMRIKQNGSWKKGFLWYNDNGEWKKVKNAYIKQNGAWVKSPY